MKNKVVYGAFMVLALSVPLSAMASEALNSYKQEELEWREDAEDTDYLAASKKREVTKNQAALEKANKAVEEAQAKLQQGGGYAASQALIAAQKAKQQAELEAVQAEADLSELMAEAEESRANAAAARAKIAKEQANNSATMGSLEDMPAIDNASQQASEAQKKAQEAAEKAQQAKENLAKLQQQQKNSGVFHGLSFHQLVDHN
ncbi:MAG: hypothetical protein J6V11_02300, partial [Alphaproteobacteria bacterium]|nr:hypothetical protein [Alphaproteobacteria bacterium]